MILRFLFKPYEELSESIEPRSTSFNNPSLGLVTFGDMVQIFALVPDVRNVFSFNDSFFYLRIIEPFVKA
jgi:hypothetical protein